MPQNLIEKLKKLIDEGGSKSELERQFKLPKNSLSAVLSGHKEMPKKWVGLIESGLIDWQTPKGDGSKTLFLTDVKTDTLDGVYVTDRKEFADDEPLQFAKSRPWVKLVEDYCGIAGITPEVLIEFHKRAKKIIPAQLPRESNKVIVTDLNEQAKPKGGYNRFAIKLGVKP